MSNIYNFLLISMSPFLPSCSDGVLFFYYEQDYQYVFGI